MRNVVRWPHGSDFPFVHRDVNRLFDTFFPRREAFPLEETLDQAAPHWQPSIDVTESDKAFQVSVELPGMDESDVEVLLSSDMLTLKGEKKSESCDEGKNCYRMERSYGSFHRSVPLPTEVQADNVRASFKKGVLTVTLPKSEKARDEYRKISVTKE